LLVKIIKSSLIFVQRVANLDFLFMLAPTHISVDKTEVAGLGSLSLVLGGMLGGI
jgi:hypothetical protein